LTKEFGKGKPKDHFVKGRHKKKTARTERVGNFGRGMTPKVS